MDFFSELKQTAGDLVRTAAFTGLVDGAIVQLPETPESAIGGIALSMVTGLTNYGLRRYGGENPTYVNSVQSGLIILDASVIPPLLDAPIPIGMKVAAGAGLFMANLAASYAARRLDEEPPSIE